MAWGPQGETVREDREATIDEVRNQSDCPAKEKFLVCYREGDIIRFQSERNNHRGFSRFVGQDKSGFTYVWVVSSFMS